MVAREEVPGTFGPILERAVHLAPQQLVEGYPPCCRHLEIGIEGFGTIDGEQVGCHVHGWERWGARRGVVELAQDSGSGQVEANLFTGFSLGGRQQVGVFGGPPASRKCHLS